MRLVFVLAAVAFFSGCTRHQSTKRILLDVNGLLGNCRIVAYDLREQHAKVDDRVWEELTCNGVVNHTTLTRREFQFLKGMVRDPDPRKPSPRPSGPQG